MAGKQKRAVLEVGSTVLNGKYEILKVIHTSGMANVYLIEDKNLHKQWCLKEIKKSEAGRNMVEYRSLLQEANIMKGLNNPNIPRIVTIEEDGDSTFIIMDYVDGLSVKEWLARKGTISQSVAVNWMKQVCGVLIYLHNRENPILYRDMKPDNIMIQGDGNIKVLDFGISVVISPSNQVIKEPLGTKGYAAPEQDKVGSKYDLRSDIYSLGMTFYRMLTGINPGIASDGIKSLRSVDSSLSMGLEVIINRCIKQNPEDRYQSVEEVLYDLNNYDKLDIDYLRKSKRKIGITAGLFVTSIVMIVGSFVPLGLHKVEQNNDYANKIEVAIQSGRTSDYIDAIKLKPLELKPYLGLIESIKSDGVFSKDEEEGLLGLINPNLTNIKLEQGYGEVAYNIGKLYWFYYDGDDGDVVSNKWFQEAIDNNFKVEESKVYYDLSNFKKTVSMAIVESEDSGIYKKYWGNLMSAKKIDSGEIVELQLYNYIADAIGTYTYRLNVDGVPKDDVLNEIKNINSFIQSSSPTSDKSEELYEQLKGKVDALPDKVEVAYSRGGAE